MTDEVVENASVPVAIPGTGTTGTNGQWMVLLAAFLGWMFDGLEMGIFPLIANPALTSLGEKDIGAWMGTFGAVFLIGAATGGIVFGWLGDRIGRVKAMTYSVLAYSVFTGAGYFAASASQLAALRFVAALGMGGEWSLGVALVMECWPEKRRPLLAGLIGAASNVGFALIALAAMRFKVTVDSWRWVMLAGAAPAALTLFIRLFVPESERWKKSAKRATKSPIVEVFSGALIKHTLIGILLAAVALIGTWGSVQWIPTWVDKKLSPGDPTAKAMAQFVCASGAILGCLVAPLAGNVLGRRISYFLLCLMSFGACAVLFKYMNEYNNAFLAVVFIVGCVTAAFYGWLPLYLPELFPTHVRATGQGISYNAARVMAAAGNLIAGYLMSAAVYNGDFAKTGTTITLVYFAGMALVWLAPETKGKLLPD